MNLRTGAWEQVLELPGEAGALTAGSNGSLYAACGVNIYQVAFPASYPDIAPPPLQEGNQQELQPAAWRRVKASCRRTGRFSDERNVS